MLSQFQENYILMTYLEAFKQNPAQAPPYLAISIYDDLIESKNLSLLRGDIVNELDKAVGYPTYDPFYSDKRTGIH